jgi:hypothetical protein
VTNNMPNQHFRRCDGHHEMVDPGPGNLGGDGGLIFLLFAGLQRAVQQTKRSQPHLAPLRSIVYCHPTLTGSACIASNTRATMSTLHAVAPIPAFIARSMLWLPRRDDVAVVALAFEGIGFTFWTGRATLTGCMASCALEDARLRLLN